MGTWIDFNCYFHKVCKLHLIYKNLCCAKNKHGRELTLLCLDIFRYKPGSIYDKLYHSMDSTNSLILQLKQQRSHLVLLATIWDVLSCRPTNSAWWPVRDRHDCSNRETALQHANIFAMKVIKWIKECPTECIDRNASTYPNFLANSVQFTCGGYPLHNRNFRNNS